MRGVNGELERALGGGRHSAGTGSRCNSNFATQVTALPLLRREGKWNFTVSKPKLV